MADRTRDDYLRELDAVLPFPDDRRAEIVEEIASHLDDAVEDGLAERDAQRRLGEPIDLARDLARPEQSAWRVLAGAGVALRSGIGHWLYGYLLASLFILVGAFGAAALIQVIGRALGTGWTLMTSDQGWNSMLVALAAAVGLYYAGRVIPRRVALVSRRLEQDVRPWAVGVTMLLAAAICVLAVDMPQNWASVIALTLAPAGVALGAYRPSLLPDGLRAYAAVAVLAMVVPIGLLLLAGAGTSTGGTNLESGPYSEPIDRNLAHIGPAWPGAVGADGSTRIESSGWSLAADGSYEWRATVAPGALTGLSDLRLEAWRVDDGMFAIDGAYDAAFAVAPVERHGFELTASIDTTGEPGTIHWDLVLTGFDEHGVRHVLTAGSGDTSTFDGRVWDWLVAVVTD